MRSGMATVTSPTAAGRPRDPVGPFTLRQSQVFASLCRHKIRRYSISGGVHIWELPQFYFSDSLLEKNSKAQKSYKQQVEELLQPRPARASAAPPRAASAFLPAHGPASGHQTSPGHAWVLRGDTPNDRSP